MKGLSPLIASVLLIAFTVSVAMIIMTWFSSFARGTTESIGATGETAVGCSSAGINIEHVYISGTNGVIVVRNIGFVPLNVTGMIVNTTGSTCTTASPTTVDVGETKALSLTNCNPPGMGGVTCSAFSRAIVSTNCAGIGDEVTSTRYVTCS
ncbi:MAG: archaellin/type IV pilin N-terminal domain-containing protein [Candidatus Aenigmatarchaeota archaeon]